MKWNSYDFPYSCKVNIAVNTRFLLPGKMEGIGKVTREVLSRLVHLMPGADFTFLFDRPFDADFIFREDIRAKVIRPPARHPVLIHAWLQRGVKKYLRDQKPDIFLSFDGFMPLGSETRSVITIHDLAYVHFPQQHRFADRWYYRQFMPKYAHEASHIITVSDFSRQDICRQLDVPRKKVSVVYNGVDPAFRPVSSADRQPIREKYTSGHPYFIYVGSIHPRKNVDGLIRAFTMYKRNSGQPDKLLITGRKAWLTGKVEDAYRASAFRDDIRFTDYVAQADMPGLVGAAKALVYVSFHEGFGLPIVEAMSAGVPVICSDRSSMPEVAGGAALLADPDQPQKIADAMAITQDPERMEKLVGLGIRRAATFNWDKAAEQYREVIRRIGGI